EPCAWGCCSFFSCNFPHHRHGFLLRRIEDLHRLVGDSSEELGGRCRFVVLAGHNAVSILLFSISVAICFENTSVIGGGRLGLDIRWSCCSAAIRMLRGAA